MTGLAEHHAALEGLPSDAAGLRAVVQGVLIHRDWQAAYGVELAIDRLADQHIRPAMEIVDRAYQLDSRPLVELRTPADRVVSTCRDYSVLYAALLRGAGQPARARCGFGGYFEAGKWCDHWITERWTGDRWAREDAQIDDVQRAMLRLDFDPADQPLGEFLTGGEAWQRCRRDGDDPKRYGIFDMWGLNFIAGDFIRDVASLNKVELLPWDCWGPMGDPNGEPQPADAAMFDDVAELAAAADLGPLRERYEDDAAFTVPPVIISFIDNVPQEVVIYEP
jgi:hypothetical protein